ncbi:hypothetical protein L484_004338 [Morus notabilis]|uniref:DUF7733 domain-containing protein n=1 Tax=Morus notabilis TaxID=981085 RepID=W9RUG8_9ROSA|nr:uncharacterized protein LOC21387841 [Morus notabilis]EXB93852.1 hypothetical protein L484_004338 [Morus notabilis]
MSGGVGPTYNDISLPQEEQQHESKQNDDNSATTSSKNKTHRTPKKRSSFLSFRQQNCLAVIVTLSATGLVCPEDMAFVLFSIIYMYFLSIVAFPKLTSKEPPVFDIQKGLLPLYVFVGAIIGLFLPIAYIFEGIFEGDKEGIKAAIPHLFLLASQVFMEEVAFSDRFSTPIRVFIPVCYNSMRISTIVEWLRNEFSKGNEEFGGSPRRLFIGRGLAIANMAFWCFNLFGFLLPVYLPKAFKRYYSDSKVKD